MKRQEKRSTSDSQEAAQGFLRCVEGRKRTKKKGLGSESRGSDKKSTRE
jgi:hypothetical protein